MALDFRFRSFADMLTGDWSFAHLPRGVARLAREIGEINESRGDFVAATGFANAVLNQSSNCGAIEWTEAFVIA